MATEDIERTIYKLELDGSGYIQGVEALSESTKKLAAEQARANQALKVSQDILKQQSSFLQQTKKDLDSYTGTNEKYRQQLAKSFSSAEIDNKKLTDTVAQNQAAYEKATRAAQDFANASAKASNLQTQTTGGKIPTAVPVGVPATITSQIAGVLNVADFAKQAQIIEQTKAEFDDLRVSIALAEARMKQLNETDLEFQQLAPIVAKGKEAIQLYDQSVSGAAKSTGTLHAEILRGREELVKLEQAGQGASDTYRELEQHVVKLTKEFNDQQERIKILSSDTRALDFGKAAIQGATAAFEVYTSISILAGDESEELQKKTMQLFAAMQLLQALEELANLTKKSGIIFVNLQSAAQAVYTGVVAASTGALRAFRLALLATGIGAAVVLIGYLVSKWLEYRDAVKTAGAAQKTFSDITNEAIKSYSAEVVKLDLIKGKLNDLNIPQKQRIDLAKEYNKTAEESNKIDLKQIDNINLVNSAIDSQIEKIKQRAFARASETIIAQRAETLLLAEEEARLNNLNASVEASAPIKESAKGNLMDQYVNQIQQKTVLAKEIQKDPKVVKAKQELDEALKIGAQFITVEGLTTETKTKTEKTNKEIENVYKSEKEKLEIRLAELNRKEADSESKIRLEFRARLIKEESEIEKLLKEKKLTKPQAEDLKQEAGVINKLALEKELAERNKLAIDARQKLNDELKALDEKNTLDQINLIQDEFERRRELIDFNEQKELEAAKENTQKRLAALDLERGLIKEKAYQDAKNILITEGEEAGLNIQKKAATERQTLAFDSYKHLLDFFRDFIFQSDLIRDEAEAAEVSRFSNLFLEGKISYEEYQRAIVAIQKRYAKIKRDETLLNDQNELRDLDNAIKATIDKTTKEYKELLRLRDEQRKKIAGETIENKKKDAEDKNTDPNAPPKDGENSWDKYVASIAAVGDSVIAFWQKTNEAEAAALDRSISLQEKRVSAAQRIADRGNAQYLKAEEDRLTELNVKRENAARKQLGIDAALQASQILVGITGAISHIAHGTFGAETIAEIAIIIGALATGYGIVKSLQGNQPKLAKGTTELKRRGEPAGIDTIPAWLNEGEAVIPTEKNKKYKKTVEAIYHGKVPADIMEEFVENYVTKNHKHEVHSNTSTTNNSFVENIHKVPASVLNQFIKNYEEKGAKKYFKGSTDVKAAGEALVPEWINQGKAVKAKNFPVVEEAILKGIPAKAISEFAEKYVKEEKVSSIVSEVLSRVTGRKLEEVNRIETIRELVEKKITVSDKSDKTDKKEAFSTSVNKFSKIVNKIYSENKTLFESKNVAEIVRKVYNETADKKLSLKEISSVIHSLKNNSEKNIVETISKLARAKMDKNVVDWQLKNTLVNQSTTLEDVHRYSESVDTAIEERKKRQRFASNVANVPDKVLTNFIKTFSTEQKYSLKNLTETGQRMFRGTTDLQGKPGIDQIPVWASKGEAIIPTDKTRIYKPVIETVFKGTIPAETLNKFVTNYHTIKPVPQPNYQRIKEAAEIHIAHDGRMSVLLSEQNRKIDENNDLQRQTLRAMKNMSISASIDRDGVAIAVNEYMEQMKIDRKI